MSLAATDKRPEQQVGRYAIFDEIAAGGMATVHLARLVGSEGFSRVVAAKRLHRHFLQDPEFKQMFLVESRLAARVLHPNVVTIVDVLSHANELIIVMDYVHGESLHALIRAANQAKEWIPIPIGCAIVAAALQGLHAAHEARNEKGEPLGIVHRDVSPHNVLVGSDGVAKVLDFGIAKAVHAQNQTNPGVLKGKFSYMSPEVINGAPITRQADVFSAAVMLWEVLTGKKLFSGASEQERMQNIISGKYLSPRQLNPGVSIALENILEKALKLDTKSRYKTALEFAIDIERVVPLASQRVVGEWVRRLAANSLEQRAALISAIEISTIVQQRPSMVPSSRLPTTDTPIAVEQGPNRTSADALIAPRRGHLPIIAMAVAAVVATLALVLFRIGSSSVSPSTQALASMPVSSSLPIANVPPVANVAQSAPAAIPSLDTPISATAAPSAEIRPSAMTVTPLKSQHSPRSAVPLPRTPAQSAAHGKHYLPSEL